MAVIRVFDPEGVKTIELMGNANEQPYDELMDEDINEFAEDTDDGF